MADKWKGSAEIIEQKQIAEDIYSVWLQADFIAKTAVPGQFVSVYCKEGSRLLPRPISICETDRERGRLRMVYRVVGKGTEEFSAYLSGDTLEIMGPLGNGYTLKEKKTCLIGGGIGIPPLLELAKRLQGEKEIVLGYRSGKEMFLKEEFERYGTVWVATEDGSAGIKGNVLDAVQKEQLEAEVIYACGPTPMLRAVQSYAKEQGIEAQISLEERMACGIGACLACVCQSKERDEHTHVHKKRICKEGPVFYAEEVDLG
ncbi:MAG: dihydroorotate dehydrogenase electron transfer subunit [Lachnospiraceae bacterium]|nr:dihydroorotate dehydrogenase electron transfer subunit [Lachnospiraceae bacterium]